MPATPLACTSSRRLCRDSVTQRQQCERVRRADWDQLCSSVMLVILFDHAPRAYGFSACCVAIFDHTAPSATRIEKAHHRGAHVTTTRMFLSARARVCASLCARVVAVRRYSVSGASAPICLSFCLYAFSVTNSGTGICTAEKSKTQLSVQLHPLHARTHAAPQSTIDSCNMSVHNIPCADQPTHSPTRQPPLPPYAYGSYAHIPVHTSTHTHAQYILPVYNTFLHTGKAKYGQTTTHYPGGCVRACVRTVRA